MSKTLKFGLRAVDSRLSSRIDRHVIRRRTPTSYDRCMQLAEQDFARHAALAPFGRRVPLTAAEPAERPCGLCGAMIVGACSSEHCPRR